MTEPSWATVRAYLVDELRKDLVGPSAPDEELTDRPTVHYLTGILFPMKSEIDSEQDNDANEAPEQDDDVDVGTLMAATFNPSAVGLSFAVERGEALTVAVSCAVYVESGEDEERSTWRRQRVDAEPVSIDTRNSREWRTTLSEGLKLFIRVRAQEDNSLVTLSLMNVRTAKEKDEHLDPDCFFQPEIRVTPQESGRPVFLDRSRLGTLQSNPDALANALLFRHVPEYAVGHGCAVTWEVEEGRKATLLRTQIVPDYEVPTLAPLVDPSLPCLDIGFLAKEPGVEALTGEMVKIACMYAGWIDTQEENARKLPQDYQEAARTNLERCREAVQRMEQGIDLIRDNPLVRRAFQLSNLAMLRQRNRSEWIKTPPETRGPAPAEDAPQTWRAFQLAFMLLVIPSIVDGSDAHRAVVDLLWFPTGGGKTEAYLALTAFTIFLRRLRASGRSEAAGVTVLMRYTLRLLTLQQFQRAATLIMACEAIRRAAESDLGSDPISLGLWVGAGATPNWLREAREAIRKHLEGVEVFDRDPCQLLECPWCGTALTPRNYHIDGRMVVRCPGEGCEFAGGMPLFLVDEDLYNIQPSLVIATVDKFARLPWLAQGWSLFGRGSPRHLPPELIVQDELHLISGPLGTLVGLYETAVDALASNDGTAPKVIASTATIHRASDQVRGLFARSVSLFPAPALDSRDTFFARETSLSDAPGRNFVGVHAAGKSVKSALLRIYALLLQRIADHKSDLTWRDPYWTLVGYFNSLRELGGARRLVDDDVRSRILGLAKRAGEKPREIESVRELTSRVGSSEIPEILQELGTGAAESGALDVLLATNMISVGVDVDRLGLMVVNGQPKTTSEYIQATSRIGRKFPGLVVTLYNWTRPRDRSHYERFSTYHGSLYRHVEASSVTPFSSRARDRGLHAVFVAMVRHMMPSMNPEEAAQLFPPDDSTLAVVRRLIAERAQSVEPEEVGGVLQQLEAISDTWARLARADALRYGRDWNNSALPHLMESIESSAEEFEGFRVLNSLREVEGETSLQFLPTEDDNAT